MEILQQPISENHKSPMFFHGVIAKQSKYLLETYQDGEIVFMDKLYVGEKTPELVKFIDDNDIDQEMVVDIHVDKFFYITLNGRMATNEDLVFNDYDEAIQGFQEYLKSRKFPHFLNNK